MALEQLVVGLAQRRGIAPPRRARGGFVLLLDRRYRIRLATERSGRIVMQARVGRLPADPAARAAQARRLLNRNLARLRAHDEVLSADPVRGTLLLHRALPADAGAIVFEQALEGFVNALAGWVKVCKPDGQPAAAPPPSMMMLR